MTVSMETMVIIANSFTTVNSFYLLFMYTLELFVCFCAFMQMQLLLQCCFCW